MQLASYVVAIIAVGVLILLHEAGHYWAARLSGMRVRKFSVGFGPALVKFERGGTTYQIGAIPLGGFAQIDGMSPHDETPKDAPYSYLNKPIHLRFATVLAGPVANYLLAFFMLFAFYAAFYSEARPPIAVTQVAPGSAAEEGGLQKEDLLIGTSSAAFASMDDLGKVIHESKGGPLVLQIERGGQKLIKTVHPKPVGEGFRLGVGFRGSQRVEKDLPFPEAASKAAMAIWLGTKQTVGGLSALIFRREEVTVSGPIGIVKGLSAQVQASWVGAFQQVAYLSIALGAFNLLPIPALDGSRLLFLLIGALRRKEVEPTKEAWVHAGGFLLLLGLFVVVSVFDLLR